MTDTLAQKFAHVLGLQQARILMLEDALDTARAELAALKAERIPKAKPVSSTAPPQTVEVTG